jgi:Saxitoxin biosynthesis operon protein SxtJ
MSNHHEDFKREAAHRGASDRNFAGVFSGLFLLLGVRPVLHHRPVLPVWLALSVVMLAICVVRPSLVRPLNLVWTRIGLLMGKVMNPIVTGLMFYLVFTPVALVLRWCGKDPLARAHDPGAESYWIRRSPSDDTTDMVNQF